MGAHESLIPAALAYMVSPERRGSAYGIFTAVYGVCWFAGSALIGVLYDVSLTALIAFSTIAQLAAIPAFLRVRNEIGAVKPITQAPAPEKGSLDRPNKAL
jgi:MFS family permease